MHVAGGKSNLSRQRRRIITLTAPMLRQPKNNRDPQRVAAGFAEHGGIEDCAPVISRTQSIQFDAIALQ